MNEKHVSDYMAAIQDAYEMTQEIQSHLGNHCDVSPDAVHAGHVGNLRHVCAELNDIKTFLGI